MNKALNQNGVVFSSTIFEVVREDKQENRKKATSSTVVAYHENYY